MLKRLPKIAALSALLIASTTTRAATTEARPFPGVLGTEEMICDCMATLFQCVYSCSAC